MSKSPMLFFAIPFLIPGLSSFGQAHADDPQTWIGKTVICTTNGVNLQQTDAEGTTRIVKGNIISGLVVRVNGDELCVRDGGVEGWAKKDAFVPLDLAVAFFTTRIENDSDNDTAYAARGWAYKERGDLPRALKDYDEAIRINPNAANWWNNRGSIRYQKKDFENAIEDLTQALTLQPNSTLALNNRALAHVGVKKYAKADADYSEVIRLAPDDPMAYNNRAWLASTCPDGGVRNGQIGLEDATKACELSHWKEANFLDTYAAACAENGRFEDAVKWENKALDDPIWSKRYGGEARQRLKLYEQHKPYREE